MRYVAAACILLLTLFSCGDPDNGSATTSIGKDTTDTAAHQDLPIVTPDANGVTTVNTGQTTPAELLAYANTLKGVPYKYGSTDPKEGFDCSGFITYVFNHFGISVPRTSSDFTPVKQEIDIKDAQAGDLILFTGTDSTIRVVGHMGIITTGPGEDVKFIHSTSGKQDGVTETLLNAYYIGRYVKTIRVFPQNQR